MSISDNLLEKKHVVDGEVVNTVQNEYDEGNRLISSNDKTYSYDKDGNQIRAGDINFDYMTSFVNGKNVKRLKSVSENEEHVASYSYTLEGHRTGKSLDSGESEISYHYNGRNVQYEQWSSGRMVRYTHPIEGGSSCSSCGCGGNSGVFTDHPISMELNGTKYYYLYNGQGSVTELINADEEVVNKYRYTPFGSPRLKVETVYNPYEYTGRRLDEETGQYYYRARMYSTEQCRFTTQDPAGMQEGPNMYAYVSNNPVNHRDPSGLIAPDAVIDGGGGGSSDPCYQLPAYDSVQECMQDWSYDYCVEHCYGDGGVGGSLVPSPPPGASCYVSSVTVAGAVIGYQYGCNLAATKWISDVATIIGAGATLGALVTGGSMGPVAVSADWLAAHAVICKNLGKGLNYKNLFSSAPIPWCK